MDSSSTHVLTEDECWQLLSDTAVGRLAVDIAGQPDIFPINYVVDRNRIVFRSAAGTKLAGAVLMRNVAFEIDGYEPEQRTAWSVVVKGVASTIERMQERYDAEELPLFPWVAWPKPEFVQIEPTLVTGRRFDIVDDVAPDASIGSSATTTRPDAVVGRGRKGLGVAPQPGIAFHEGAPRLHPD